VSRFHTCHFVTRIRAFLAGSTGVVVVVADKAARQPFAAAVALLCGCVVAVFVAAL